MPPYYFDVLPLHPQPEPLESLTSYLMRLAQANGIPTLFRFQPIIFPGDRDHGDRMRTMKDLPLHSCHALVNAAFCTETALQAATFYYLAQKFGRPPTAKGASPFLKGSLAEDLRYCPLCLQTASPYYLLPWRFLALAGCPYHGCRLLDRCCSCGSRIPLLSNVLRVNVCPRCFASLGDGRVELMSDAEYRQAQVRFRDLAFLLTPPEQEVALGAVGPRLAYWRKARQLGIEGIAEHLGEGLRTAQSLERRFPKRGLKFRNYLAYVDYLGVTFEELFNTLLTPEEEGYTQCLSPEQRFQQRETEILCQVTQAVGGLHEQSSYLNQAMVSRVVGATRSSLRRYPQVREALIRVSQDRQEQAALRKQQVEQEWVNKVEQAIESLRTEGQPVTQVAIGRLLNLHRRGWTRYPRVKAIMKVVAEEYRQKTTQQKEKLLQDMIAGVHRSIAELKAQDRPVTKLGIAKMIGVSKGLLNYYPEVRLIFAQCAEWTGKPPGKRKP